MKIQKTEKQAKQKCKVGFSKHIKRESEELYV